MHNSFVVVADMTSATWNTVAAHKIANTVNDVHYRITPFITGTLTDAADTAYIQLGITGVTNSLIASTGAAGVGGSILASGKFWVDAGAPKKIVSKATLDTLDFVVTNGVNIGYEITGAALTGGNITFLVEWEPANLIVNSPGASSIGDGGIL